MWMQSSGQLLLSRHLYHTYRLHPLTDCPDQYSFASASYAHWDIATWCAGTVLSNQKSSFCCCFSNFVRNSFLLIKAQYPRSKANMTFSDLSFSFYSWSAKTHWHILKEKLEVGLFTWILSFGISQTTFVSQISGDPLTHTLMEFFISVKFLSFTYGSLSSAILWKFLGTHMDRQMQQIPLLHSKLSN